MTNRFQYMLPVSKVDMEHGVVFGFATVSKEGGSEYWDTQGDQLTDAATIRATLRFADSARVGKANHTGDPVGDVPCIFPLTEEIAKSNGIHCDRYGTLIGFRIHDPEVLKGFNDGEFAGFSIGGELLEFDELEKSANEDLDALFAKSEPAYAKYRRNNPRRRKVHDYAIGEISLVRLPAQEGATPGIIKSATDLLVLMKSADATIVPFMTADIGTLSTEFTIKADDRLKAPAFLQLQEQVAALLKGHTMTTPDETKGPTATEFAEMKKKLADQGVLLAVTKSVVGLSADHRGCYDALTGDSQAAFLKMDGEARDAEVAKSTSADPVVLTYKGQEYRASDDPRLVQMAKDGKARDAVVSKMQEDAEVAGFEKQIAASVLKELPGDDTLKARALRHLQTAPEDVAKCAIEMLTAGATAVEAGQTAQGQNYVVKEGDEDPAEPVQKTNVRSLLMAKYQPGEKT